ncbi:MAG: PIG-L family deacetylase [bacterium]|nr:PIG-L family deacetylase [bacterium]
MENGKLHILVFGAHPDDCDIKAGGLAIKYASLGHRVKFVSHTNGATGHHEIGGIELAVRRYQEAQAAAGVAGIEYQILDNHTGELEPSVYNRKEVIRIIREFKPDLVLSHRPNDYHPDHRYSAMLVQDAAYIVTVPNMCPLTPYLKTNPVIMYLSDHFQKPIPFQPDVVIDIDDVIEKKVDMLHCHTSQMYEWLPFNGGVLDQVPAGEAERREWMAGRRLKAFLDLADRYREPLKETYGAKRGAAVTYAEAFEVCEYGSPLTPERRSELFPFLSQ